MLQVFRMLGRQIFSSILVKNIRDYLFRTAANVKNTINTAYTGQMNCDIHGNPGFSHGTNVNLPVSMKGGIIAYGPSCTVMLDFLRFPVNNLYFFFFFRSPVFHIYFLHIGGCPITYRKYEVFMASTWYHPSSFTHWLCDMLWRLYRIVSEQSAQPAELSVG